MSEEITVHKIATIVQFTDDYLAMLRGEHDNRSGHIKPPTEEEIAAYKAWKRKFKRLRHEGRRNGWFTDGGPDYGFTYHPPDGEWVYDDEETA